MKKFNFLLFHEEDELLVPNRKRKYNYKLRWYLNYYEIRELLLAIDPRLKAVVNLKDRLELFYDENMIPDTPEVPKKEVPTLKYNKHGKPTKKSQKEKDPAIKFNQKK